MLAHASPVEHVAIVVVGIAAVTVYSWAWTRGPKPSVGRLASWTAAVVVLLLALSPTAEVWAARSFTGHMAQHLALLVAVAPLVVAARPVRTVGPVLGIHDHRPGRWWRRRSVLLAPLLFLGVLYVTHLTDVYDWALQNRVVHDLEHVAYLASAVALWASVTAPRPRDGVARVGAAIGVIGGTALLGVVLLSADQPLVPTYLASLGAEEALEDQRRAASFMWAGGMGLTLPLLLVSVWVWASAEERIVRRREQLTGGADERFTHPFPTSSTPPRAS